MKGSQFLTALVTFALLLPTDSLVSRAGISNSRAQQFSGISSKIADLVTEAFNSQLKANQNQNRQDAVTIGGDQPSPISQNSLFMSGFLKLLGLDGRKIGAAAMNGIVFIAQMLGNTLVPVDEADEELPKELPKGDIMDWIMENEQVSNVLVESKDENLPNFLIESLRDESFKSKSTDCIFMLLCKMKPFIRNMQNVVAGKVSDGAAPDRVSILFQHIPTMEEYKSNGEKCESSYRECNLF